MDPSEFEGTIERENDIVNAGALENLLGGSELPKFQCLDLTKETQNIYLAIYNLQDLLKQKEKTNVMQNDLLLQEVEEISAKVVELKEEYLTRRQNLKNKVKTFLTNLPHIRSEDIEAKEIFTFSQESEQMVNQFKEEYDFLVSTNKYLESSYLQVVKHLQDFPDYHSIIEEALQVCLKVPEIVKNAQEQLNIAEKIVIQSCGQTSTSIHQNSPHPSASNVTDSSTHFPSIQKIIHYLANQEKSFMNNNSEHPSGGRDSRDHSLHNNYHSSNALASLDTMHGHPSRTTVIGNTVQGLEDLQESYQLELNALKNKYELELKNQFHRQLLTYQEQELQITKRLEGIIHEKEQEIQDLYTMISNYELKSQLLTEQEKMISQEKEKKEQMEEKLRQQYIDLTNLQNTYLLKEQAYQQLEQQYQELSHASQVYQQTTETKIQELQKRFEDSHQQLLKAQQSLSLLPKEADIREFANELGFHESSIHQQEAEEDVSGEKRDTRSLTWSDLQRFLQQTIRRLNSEVITSRLQETELTQKITNLESINQQILKKCENYEIQIKLLEDEIRLSGTLGNSKILDTLQSTMTNHSSLSKGNNNSPLPNHSFVDLELNQTKRVTSDESRLSTIPISTSISTTVNEEYVSILQQQRNHYMKQTERIQQELQQYKNLNEQLEIEKEQLTTENMELYRRLRVLRVTSTASGGSSTTSTSNSVHNLEIRSRRFDSNSNNNNSTTNNGGSHLVVDGLDQKYHQLYELNDLNPYKVLELEKKQYVSSLSFLERMIITFYQWIMKDPTLRQLFLMYLLFIHFLSFLYIFQILNPQLIEEVDQHLKNQWSTETFAREGEHPDLVE